MANSFQRPEAKARPSNGNQPARGRGRSFGSSGSFLRRPLSVSKATKTEKHPRPSEPPQVPFAPVGTARQPTMNGLFMAARSLAAPARPSTMPECAPAVPPHRTEKGLRQFQQRGKSEKDFLPLVEAKLLRARHLALIKALGNFIEFSTGFH
eukprot:s4294_g2.t1